MLKKSVFFILLLIAINNKILLGQEPGGGGPGGGNDVGNGNPPPGWVPIDGGIAALLVVGVGYGAKKAYDYRSKRQKNSLNKMD
jgi:hypothetical protein